MPYKEEIVECDACGKKVPRSEIRHLRLKTCCSYRRVPVCQACWNEMHKKSQGKYDKEKLVEGYKGVYVIHEHDATNLHWDLRLQFPVESIKASLDEAYTVTGLPNNAPDKPGFVLRSWAIPKHKIPSGDNKLLAAETFPHNMNYKSYTGIIEEGSYGAGKVDIIESGTFTILDLDYDKKYVIEFNGKELDGIYALIKTTGKDWLWLRVKNVEKYGSIIDYPREDLLDKFWVYNDQNIPHVRDQYRDKIIINLYKSFRKAGFRGVPAWLKGVKVTGSITTNLYNPHIH